VKSTQARFLSIEISVMRKPEVQGRERGDAVEGLSDSGGAEMEEAVKSAENQVQLTLP
jgi:hypothetical protein